MRVQSRRRPGASGMQRRMSPLLLGLLSSLAAGNAAAQQCSPGSFSPTGNEPCTLAPPGRYVPNPGATTSLIAPVGTFVSAPGSVAATPAPLGFFVSTPGAVRKLFIFLHLEPTYKNKVWVIIDAGEDEQKIISKMKDKYIKAGWNETNFGQFSEHDFEKYYPSDFKPKVDEIIKISDKQKRRQAKKELLEEVKQWIASDENIAKEKFKESAKEVIEKLKLINKEINK